MTLKLRNSELVFELKTLILNFWSFLLLLMICFLILISTTLSFSKEKFKRDSVVVSTISGNHKFDVELAETKIQQQQGLQNRKILNLNSGMLFVFKSHEPVAMWMKNTFVSLDILFLSSDGKIINIAQNTNPLSLDAILSNDPVKGILEINAGSVTRLKIRIGDKVHHSAFK